MTTLQARAEHTYRKAANSSGQAASLPLTPCCLGTNPLSEYAHQIDPEQMYKVGLTIADTCINQYYTGDQLGWLLKVLSGCEKPSSPGKKVKRVDYKGLTIRPTDTYKTNRV